MPITVTCPACQTRIAAPDAAAGRAVKCPKCAARVAVPPDDDPDPPPREGRRARPAKAGRTAPGTSPLLVGGVVAAVALVGAAGAGALWWATRDKPKETAAAPKAEPQPKAAPAAPRRTPADKQSPATEPPGATPRPAGPAAVSGNTVSVPGRFRARFPAPPNEDEPLLAGFAERKVTGTFYRAADGLKRAYYAGYLDHPPGAGAPDRKKNVDHFAESFTRGYAGFEPVSRGKVTVRGREWDEVVVRPKDGPYTIVSRTLDAGPTAYIVAVEDEDGAPPADALRRFFESVEVE